MSAIEYVRPRLRVDMPAILVGSLFAYEDVLCTFAARIVALPVWSGAALNTVALTSERLIAFDSHGATESTIAIPLSTVTGISSPADAAAGRVSVVSAAVELHLAELEPVDAEFVQTVIYHAAAGRLYRVGQPEPRDG
ncbi:MAG TPA: hypothetical protein VIU62_02220 [Chloroflexota bacterium]|jgi:hypothetical protein